MYNTGRSIKPNGIGVRLMPVRFFFFVFLFFSIQSWSQAQSDTIQRHRIGSILIDGLKQTRPNIIQRELTFKHGDLLSKKELDLLLVESKYLIQNTNLFAEIMLKSELDSNSTWNIHIKLREKWMLYPLPKFSLLDRNFNEWLYTFNGDVNRIIYGLQLTHLNLTGRADPLTIRLYNGFTRTFSMSYLQPNIDSQMRTGIYFNVSYTDNRLLSYKTGFDNRLKQLQSAETLRKSYSASVTLRHRNLLYNRSFLTLQVSRLEVSDAVLDSSFNPTYLNTSSNGVVFPDISYSWQHLHVDNINYPLKGGAYGFSISKRGLKWEGGINMLTLDAYWKKYKPLKRDFYLQWQYFGQLKLPFRQPYINQRGLGYGDYMLSGLDRYVIDGVASSVMKTSLIRKILSVNLPNPFKTSQQTEIPLQIFLRGFTHQGFSYLPEGQQYRMNNRLLYTGGIGIDLISLYDVRLALDYSFNQFGENGLFLQIRNFF
jgi:outer membrane protein assembly factor BamA